MSANADCCDLAFSGFIKSSLASKACQKQWIRSDDGKKVGNCEVLKASRYAFTDHQAQHQTQIETGDVDEEPLENVLTTSEVHTSHSTCFVAVGEWPFQHQPSPPQ